MTTVVSLNLASQHSGNIGARRSMLMDALLTIKPEIIALQRVSARGARHIVQQLNLRLTGSTKGPYQHAHRSAAAGLGLFGSTFSSGNGVAIITRYPIRATDGATVEIGRIPVLRMSIALPSGPVVDVISTQLEDADYAHQQREDQLLALLGWHSGKQPSPFVVLAGGFYSEPTSDTVNALRNLYHYRSAFELANGHEVPATFPTSNSFVAPNQLTEEQVARCVDYIFFSQRMPAPSEVKICCGKPAADDNALFVSDHVGICATFDENGAVSAL